MDAGMNSHAIPKVVKMALDKSWQTVIDWILRIGTPVLLGLSGWILGHLSDELHAVQAASVENTAAIREMRAAEFDMADAMASEKRHHAELAAIRNVIIEMERRLPTRTEFDGLSDSIQDLRQELRERRSN